MRNRIKLCLQLAWVFGTLAMLVTVLNSCLVTPYACAGACENMLLAVFVASFPTGVVGNVVSLLLVGIVGGDPLTDHVIILLFMSCAGYVQWFVLVPNLFDKPTFTTLGLEQRVVDPREAMPEVTPLQTSKAPTPKRKRVRSIPAYDRHGRTPFERVIARYS